MTCIQRTVWYSAAVLVAFIIEPALAQSGGVLDENYYTAVSPSNDANVDIMGRERTYGVSFQYNWN